MIKILSKPLAAVLLPLTLTACGTKEKLPLLEGRFSNATQPVELTLLYDHDGDIYSADIMTDSTGRFTYDAEIPEGTVDCVIYSGHSAYGVVLQNGKSVSMEINGENVEFEGDNTEINEFMNSYQQAFSVWKFKPTPDKPFNYEEYISRLEKGTLNARQYLAQITDNSVRENYSKLVDGYSNYYRLRIMSMNGDKESEATKAILDSIDPNADYARLTGLISYWYNSAPFRPKGMHLDATEYFIREFAMIDSALTNDANKKPLYRDMGNFYLSMVTDEAEIKRFFDGIEPQMQRAPMVKAEFQNIIDERARQCKDGSELPSNPMLIDIDGNKTDLITELQGKVAYIDLWATWCGPCCREIPFMEKLAEKYASNDKIRFISISEDEETETWAEKIRNDKPTWPNFIFDKKTGREFLDAINCHSIPRFLLIGADGRFIAVNAARPSSKEIDGIIKAAIGE